MLFVLHADHEQNCSTSTVRLVGSSQREPVRVGLRRRQRVVRAAARRREPGGAGDAGAHPRSGDDVAAFVKRVKNKEPGVKLMGFGHRVYKNYDPRATIVKKARRRKVLDGLGKPDPLLDIAMELEEVALADDYFVERKLYPNVDFYTGVIYKAMGFPTHMFTVLFALGRLPGWIAQWREMIEDPDDEDRPPAAGLRRRPGAPYQLSIAAQRPPGGQVGVAGSGLLEVVPTSA